MADTVPTTFADAPVLALAPTRVRGRAQTFDRRTFRFEAPTSGLHVAALDPQPGGTHEFTFVGLTRAEVRAVEDFFDDRRGSYEAFWFPTWQFEFALTAVSTSAVTFADNGYSDRLYPHTRWRWMAIAGPAGAGARDLRAFEVVAATNTGMTAIDTNAAGGTGWATQPAERVLLCRLAYGRLLGDRIETRWKTLDAATVRVSLEEVER